MQALGIIFHMQCGTSSVELAGDPEYLRLDQRSRGSIVSDVSQRYQRDDPSSGFFPLVARERKRAIRATKLL
jgi:hypothetical protein